MKIISFIIFWFLFMFFCQSPLYLANEQETLQGLKRLNEKDSEGRNSLESTIEKVKRAKGVNSGVDNIHRPKPNTHSDASTLLAKHSFFIIGSLIIQLSLQLLFASLIFF
ncbi:hypothetical protein AQUCO_01600271v1 [Aquilegia coerulea]|uniref:Uncharacterized protein n=1 Tax=Aquilegia coerulea TaxID=218851 RepID=A0A2G5DQV3_AQUCA|nr:hypothetical protein AQUCO_01600271v1 [Aquilegia coerulea]